MILAFIQAYLRCNCVLVGKVLSGCVYWLVGAVKGYFDRVLFCLGNSIFI